MSRLPDLIPPLELPEARILNEALGLPDSAGAEERIARARKLGSMFKGRMAQAKLSEKAAKEIRSRYGNGERVAELSYEYGVSGSCIYEILRNRAWKQ